ncbi:MAG: hypothetical protein WAS21_21115 [Geminicoccaceae bacterium]
MPKRPYIVYLDQNKWIELARAVKYPADYPAQHALFVAIAQEIQTGRLILPLTAANIYETHKTNDTQRRHELAVLQATASQGLVFRGRHRRLETELSDLLFAIHGRPVVARAADWFLSDLFFEAFADFDDERLISPISQQTIDVIRAEPARWLYKYLVATPEDVRIGAVQRFSGGSERLRQRIEERRCQHAGESLAMRRRIMSALLILDDLNLILKFANSAGYPWQSVGDIGKTNMRRIIEDVPIYYVEREIALRLESQTRLIEVNDFRDMQSFCATIPYADEVIGENQFVNLARQARLDKKYCTKLATNILDLGESLERLEYSKARRS